jgi:hypothetical protein
MGFFRELLTDGSGLSSKRFLSLFGMLVLTGVIGFTLYDKTVPDIVYISLVTIVLGGQGLTLFNKKVDGKSTD